VRSFVEKREQIHQSLTGAVQGVGDIDTSILELFKLAQAPCAEKLASQSNSRQVVTAHSSSSAVIAR